MSRKPPSRDIDENQLTVGHAKDHAAGPTAVAVTMKRAIEQMGVRRATTTLRKLNQVDGFDCQGCAWPDPSPEHRHTAEFCENGAKAVTEEATRRHIGREFFAAHPIVELDDKTDYWLGQQGRIIEPMVLRPGGQPLRADLVGRRVRAGRRAAAGARQPRRGDLLHLRQDVQRGGVRLPALRARARHQQPARLLQHVPRVHLGGAGRGDRHRQGLGHPRGRAHRRADRDRRPEPRHQPPADADRRSRRPRGTARRSSRSTRSARPGWCASRTPRSRAAWSAAAPSWPTCTCRCGSTATWRCSRPSARCCWSGTPSTVDFVEQFTSGFEEYAAHVKDARLGPGAGAAPG